MILALLGTSLAIAAQASAGAPECPCLTNTSADFGALQLALLSVGLPTSYGTIGCKAYDENNPAFGCASNEKIFCLQPWCYVDKDLCPMDVDACLAAGGKAGGNTSAYCRSRKSAPSELFASDGPSFEYSYATCGAKDDYTPVTVRYPSGGEVAIAIKAWSPWIVTRQSASGEIEYAGPLFDFFLAALELYAPQVTMRIIPGWSTSASRARYSNSYTACVHDVAVGNFDLCVADLWITPERLMIAPFTIPIRYDNFYLIAPVHVEQVTLSARLRRPLAPLTNAAWGVVAAFLLIMMFVLVLVRLWDMYDGHLEKGCKVFCKYMARETCLTFFDVHHTFLTGGTHEGGPKTLANLVLRSALAVFGLIILASYTASLASILVVERDAVGDVQNIDHAIERGVTICTPSAAYQSFSALFPRAAASGLLVEMPQPEDAPRKMYAGECGAAIMSHTIVDQIHAGFLQKLDCELAESGALTEEEAHCHNGFSGKARDDCQFVKVGEVLLSWPVAFAVSDNIQQSMSWAFAQLQAFGVWEEKVKLHADLYPQTQCRAERPSDADGLDVDALSGTFIISFVVVMVGVLIFVCQMCPVKTTRHKHGDILTWLDDEPENGEQVQGEEVQREHGEYVQHANGETVQRAHIEKEIDQVKSKLEEICIIAQNIEGQTRTLSEGMKQQPPSSAGSTDEALRSSPRRCGAASFMRRHDETAPMTNPPSSTGPELIGLSGAASEQSTSPSEISNRRLQSSLSHILGRYPTVYS